MFAKGGVGCLIGVLVGCLPALVGAQEVSVYDVVYRPPGVRYQVLDTDHFEVIFQQGMIREAQALGAILEGELPEVQRLVGARSRLRMPVVLNGFNDRANGYVTPLPFKQEIEGIAIRGNRLSARFSSWLWAVGPHELVHAAHADAGRGLGIGAGVRLFAPDAARAFNLLYPPGINEGAAVFHESRVQPGAGRLHFSLFQMQFRAAMLSDDPWSLAQALEAPLYDQPANRYYIGGANVFRYLYQRDQGRFFRRMLDLHYRLPFLGLGLELWLTTGTPPWTLGRRFRATVREEETARLAALGTLTYPEPIAAAPGRTHRRPRWINDSTLVAYVTGYATRPGLYRIDAPTGQCEVLSHQRLTEDQYFSLTPDTSAVLFARYVPDATAPIQALADVFRVSLHTGEAERLTHDARVVAPVETDAAIWALRNDGPFTQWVRLNPEDGLVTPLSPFDRMSFVSLLPRPGTEEVLVLANVNGHQGVFDVELEAGRVQPRLLFEDAAILDATWHAGGRYLLFTADPGGIANVYAYEPDAGLVVQLTNAAYGALEPDVSPDGRWLAFVHYQHEQWDLARIPFAPDAARELPPSAWTYGRHLPWQAWLFDDPDGPLPEATIRPYRVLPHLAPRMVYPTLRYDNAGASGHDTELGLGVGLAVQGADPLERWAYAAEARHQHDRLWGRATVQAGRFVLRPFLSVFDEPSTTPAVVRTGEGGDVETRRVGREERGATLGLRLPYVLASNVFTTQASLSLRGTFEQERIFDRDGATLQAFQGRVRVQPSAALQLRVQRNPRDLLPNTGVVLNTVASVDAWREEGRRREALLAQLDVYVPAWLRRHTGLRLFGGLLTQNQGSIFNLDSFVPRGYEDVFFGAGTFIKLGSEVVQPFWYVEDGFVILPLYVHALYVYGFGETMMPVGGSAGRQWFSSVGGGLGIQFRWFYRLSIDLRIGAAYRVEEGQWEAVAR